MVVGTKSYSLRALQLRSDSQLRFAVFQLADSWHEFLLAWYKQLCIAMYVCMHA